MNLLKTKLRLGVAFLTLMSLTSAKADEIEVFAASSLTDSLKEITAAYEKASGDTVIFNFAASSALAIQIKAGAPADLFFSADEAKMDDLDKAGLIVKETRRDVLQNSLVIIAPAESALTLSSPAQLAGDNIKHLALGAITSVPAGIYAKEYLEKIGIWPQVEARVIPCENVRAALAAVETDNVDAGIVYKTDALHSQKVKVICEIAPQDGPKIVYPAAVIADSKHAAAAKKFLDYLGDPESLKTFAKYGFITHG
jgi:molybdate transport system substrate-binding protein